MAIDNDLDRLLPGVIEEPTNQHVARLNAFLLGLSKRDYEKVLKLLPDRLTRRHDPIVKTANVWARFVDEVAYNAVHDYTRHVAAADVLDLLTTVNSDVHRLRQTMSPERGVRLLRDVFALAVAALREYLESHLKRARPGLVDRAIEMLLSDLARKKFWQRGLTIREARDERILQALQEQRRQDPARLPIDVRTTADARFFAEEAHRELFAYPPHTAPPNLIKARSLIAKVYAWFKRSPLYEAERGDYGQLYTLEREFFYALNEMSDKLAIGLDPGPEWKGRVVNRLRSDEFWRNVAGLNKDIPLEATEAGSRAAAYRRGAVVGTAAILSPIVVLVTVKLAIAAPGAVGSLFRWAGGRLLVATQYVQSTYQAFGVVGGTARIAKDAYALYAANAVRINQAITNGAEITLEFAGAEMAFAPGASPVDLSSAAVEQFTKNAGMKGISRLADEAQRIAVGSGRNRMSAAGLVEVNQIELLAAEAADGQLYNVLAKVKSGDATKINAVVIDYKKATDIDGTSRKTIAFYVKNPDRKAVVEQARATRQMDRPRFDNATSSTEVAPPKQQPMEQRQTQRPRKGLGKLEAEERRATPVSTKSPPRRPKKGSGKLEAGERRAIPVNTKSPQTAPRRGDRSMARRGSTTGPGDMQTPRGDLTPAGIELIRRHFRTVREGNRWIPLSSLTDAEIAEWFFKRPSWLEAIVLAEVRASWVGLSTTTDFAMTKPRQTLNDVATRLRTAIDGGQTGHSLVTDMLRLPVWDYVREMVRKNDQTLAPAFNALENLQPTTPENRSLIARWNEFKTSAGRGDMSGFFLGTVGSKRPELVEVFLTRNTIHVTDVTFAYEDPVHNFKSAFYRSVIERLINVGRVTATDYRSALRQTPIGP